MLKEMNKVFVFELTKYLLKKGYEKGKLCLFKAMSLKVD